MAKNKKINTRKNTNSKNNNTVDELDLSFKKNAVVIGSVLTVFIIFYLITIWVTRDKTAKSNEEDSYYSTFSYTNIVAGRSFSMSDGEYYVLYYDSTDTDLTSTYSSLVSSYRGKEDALTIYTVNMGDGLNKRLAAETSNTHPNNASEIAISGPTLIRFNNHEVVEYVEGEDSIRAHLEY